VRALLVGALALVLGPAGPVAARPAVVRGRSVGKPVPLPAAGARSQHDGAHARVAIGRPGDLRPAEILHRNFWFSTIDDPSTLSTRETVGIDRITFESDYPRIALRECVSCK